MSSLLVLALTVVTTVAGVPGVPGAGDGPAHAATFNRPTWLDVVPAEGSNNGRAGDVLVVDRANRSVRRISAGNVTTPKFAYSFANPTPFPFDFGGPFGGGIAIEPPGAGCGSSEYDSGFWVSTTESRQIALLSMSGRPAARDDIAPFIGLAGGLTSPTGLAISKPYGGFEDAYKRALYIADSGAHVIRRAKFSLSFEACPQHKWIDVLAGTAGVAGWQDGPAASARFNVPRGLATALDGSVYVADSGNHAIRRIDANGNVTTIAGVAGVAGSDARHLNTPSAVEVRADGTIFIADSGNHAIRMLGPNGELVTIAGRVGVAGFADGPGDEALFAGPVGLKLALDGSLYVADTSNQVVRRIAFVDAEPRRRAVRR
jgi:sugar lactone lactonase YvrE